MKGIIIKLRDSLIIQSGFWMGGTAGAQVLVRGPVHGAYRDPRLNTISPTWEIGRFAQCVEPLGTSVVKIQQSKTKDLTPQGPDGAQCSSRLPHHFVCVEKFTAYLTLPLPRRRP